MSRSEINSEFNFMNANLVVAAGCEFIVSIAATNRHQQAKGYGNEETCHVAEYTVHGRSDRNRRANCREGRCDGWSVHISRNWETTRPFGSTFRAAA